MGWQTAWRVAAYGGAVAAGFALMLHGGLGTALGLVLLTQSNLLLHGREGLRRRYLTPLRARDLLRLGGGVVAFIGVVAAAALTGVPARLDALPEWIQYVAVSVLWMAALLVGWSTLRKRAETAAKAAQA